MSQGDDEVAFVFPSGVTKTLGKIQPYLGHVFVYKILRP